MQNYEFYFIINPELSGDQTKEIVESIKTIITTDFGAENVIENSEGLKKLSYLINKHQTGFYTSITFNINDDNTYKVSNFEKKINLIEPIIRYILINQTDFLVQKSKEKLNIVTDITTHRDLNKANAKKKDLATYLGYRVIDFKNIAFLNQFTSPYAKIFIKEKTGTSAKSQRKIAQAIKRARHMALMPFTSR
ncbi:MAG: 30S ribosomal protein S18 [candidate division SR1 bacterium]|nr:30S ribosomal protein S18 [candidate division SR1 bacterium]